MELSEPCHGTITMPCSGTVVKYVIPGRGDGEVP